MCVRLLQTCFTNTFFQIAHQIKNKSGSEKSNEKRRSGTAPPCVGCRNMHHLQEVGWWEGSMSRTVAIVNHQHHHHLATVALQWCRLLAQSSLQVMILFSFGFVCVWVLFFLKCSSNFLRSCFCVFTNFPSSLFFPARNPASGPTTEGKCSKQL